MSDQSGTTGSATVVLVHGAFADASGWNGVIERLQAQGVNVIAPANPLRGIAIDSAYISSVLAQIEGPVIAVGHSYGGAVISQAAASADNVRGLIYVDAFSLDVGESIGELGAKFPAAPLGAALAPIPLSDGGTDLYIRPDQFGIVFAPDIPASAARLGAVEQRPISAAAFGEKPTAAAWRTLPSWHIYGSSDMAIPPAELAFMADRAHARRVVVVPGGSHVTLISHPHEVAALIEAAATSP